VDCGPHRPAAGLRGSRRSRGRRRRRETDMARSCRHPTPRAAPDRRGAFS
jgi:hypothetical protein